MLDLKSKISTTDQFHCLKTAKRIFLFLVFGTKTMGYGVPLIISVSSKVWALKGLSKIKANSSSVCHFMLKEESGS